MRVLLLSQFYPPVIGGEERHVRNLAAALAARGHSVSVATQATQQCVGTEMDGAVSVHRLHGTLQRMGALFSDPERPFAPPIPDPGLMLGLRTVIAQERPDVIHAHNWLLHSFLPLKPFSRAPLIVTLHDYSLVCASKNLMRMGLPCGGPALAKCMRCANQHYRGIKGNVVVAANWIDAALECRLVDKFLAVSRAVARLNRLDKTRVPFEIIPNFVPDDVHELSSSVRHSELSQLPDQYILFVGDLHPLKGVTLLIDAYARLQSAPTLVLIGRRFPETPVKLPPNVHIFEPWPHAAIMHAWSRSLFGVAPSVLHEACATVVLEAMTQGKPMVVTDVGGMPELVTEGETGLVVKPDASSLSAALARLLANPGLRQRMGVAARNKVTEFKAGAVVSRIECVYHDLVAQRAARVQVTR
jgi:glycosyltransferase involved in cell wall biosynthesis